MPRVSGRLAGRTAVVTGSSGIAAATAVRFAAEGARVVVISRTEAGCRALAERIVATGGDAGWAVADLEDEAATEAAVTAAAARLGRIDVCVAVAGGSGRRHGDAFLHELSMEGWERTIAMNARTQVTTLKAVLRRMLAQPADAGGARGSIVTMASILALRPDPAHFPTHAYAAAKGAIVALTTATAAAYVREGIRVNAVAPALTVSRMSERAQGDPATIAFAARRQPLVGGFLAAEDVADAALFLASPESRGITGQVLVVDGGWSVTGE